MSILKGILHHWNKTNSAYDTIHPETESAQVTDWHQAVKNSVISEDIKSEILQFQATLSQKTVPSGNTGALTSLLSGIVHQIAALSGKTNWWETPKNSFETLSVGVVAGDVSDPNSWWVKFGGAVPLIIQGGRGEFGGRAFNERAFPISFSKKIITAIPNDTNMTVGTTTAGIAPLGWCIPESNLSKARFLADQNYSGEKTAAAYQWIAIGY